jgi:integrase
MPAGPRNADLLAALSLIQSRLGVDPDDRGPLVRALFERWWDVHGRHTPSATKAIRPASIPVLKAFGDRYALDVTLVESERYREVRRQQPTRLGDAPAEGTIDHELWLLHAVFEWAVAHQPALLPYNPLKGLRRTPAVQRQGSIRGADLEAICAHAEPWFRALLIVLVYTGQRVGAVRELRWDDVDLDAGEIRIRKAGTWNKRTGRPLLLEPAIEALRQLPRISPYVWPSTQKSKRDRPITYGTVRRHLLRAAEAAGVSTADGYICCHHARHGFALEASEVWGWSQKLIMEAGGWSTPQAMLRYGAIDRESREAARARAAIAIKRRRRGPHRATSPETPVAKTHTRA